MQDNIKQWINTVSIPKTELGGMSVCPYARGAKYELVETDGYNINPLSENFELIIYKLPDNYTIEQLFSIAANYNNLFPKMIFLPDHKDKKTFINGVQTNNGIYNLILCQYRDNLESARSKLKTSNYYNHWDKDYLNEIFNT